MAPRHLVWLAHALPAVALTITAPSTPVATPTTCGTENLIKEGSFSGVSLDDGVWTVAGTDSGTVVDNYLFVLSVDDRKWYTNFEIDI